jgi:DnaJ homolog subfamily C member 2
MPTITKIADGLDWPTTTGGGGGGNDGVVPKVTIECAGKGFVDYYALFKADHEELWLSMLAEDAAEASRGGDDDDDDINDDGSKLPAIDLFSLSEKQLEKIDYYKVLHLPYKPTITPDDVKKAYRKACLKYHPDKSGRDEEDAVFLKVKAAFETLSTSKLAYDSTEMPFDDALPSEQPKDFFKEYGPIFARNAHFDAKLLPRQNSSASSGSGGRRKSRGNNKQQKQQQQQHGPPPIGDDNTPIDEVHAFYDYWTHFESWRDFTLQAARELEAEDHLENAESRFEKRWYQKEIDRQAKKLKQQEVGRIATLVERAMAVDPRLVQERKRLAEEKEQKQRDREQQATQKKKKEEEARLAEERRAEEEKKRKSEEKFLREKEKKMLRKAKQAFKKYVSQALEELLEKEFALEDEVDLICGKLNRDMLTRFNDRLEGKSASDVFSLVKKRAEGIKNGVVDDETDGKGDDVVENTGSSTNGTKPQKSTAEEATITNGEGEMDKTSGKENDTAVKHPTPSTSSSGKKKTPFTKEELSALAKGVKKFPPGGANRWDQIASYVNNLCRPEDPRTKEECIEVFNQINKASKLSRSGNQNNASTANTPSGESSATAATTPSNDNSGSSADGWTAEEDQQLQAGLAKYPASMDKNERWTKIAEEVPGKSKKDCVERFKTIRDALKAKK